MFRGPNIEQMGIHKKKPHTTIIDKQFLEPHLALLLESMNGNINRAQNGRNYAIVGRGI